MRPTDPDKIANRPIQEMSPATKVILSASNCGIFESNNQVKWIAASYKKSGGMYTCIQMILCSKENELKKIENVKNKYLKDHHLQTLQFRPLPR